jgi:hypothetical protein
MRCLLVGSVITGLVLLDCGWQLEVRVNKFSN